MAVAVVCEADGPGEPTRCLLEVFSSLKSSRDPRGTIYPLAPTLALVLIALLSGCKNPSQISAFGRSRPQLLAKLGFRPRRRPRKSENRGRVSGPNEDTIKNILQSVDGRSGNPKGTITGASYAAGVKTKKLETVRNSWGAWKHAYTPAMNRRG